MMILESSYMHSYIAIVSCIILNKILIITFQAHWLRYFNNPTALTFLATQSNPPSDLIPSDLIPSDLIPSDLIPSFI